MILFIVCLLFAVSISRTLYIQLVRGVDSKIVEKRLVVGERGVIYDRNGKKIAYNVEMSDIFLDDANSANKYEVALFMERNFGLNIDSTTSLIDNNSGYLVLLENVIQNKIKNIEHEINQVSNMNITPLRNKRYYPQNNLASQLIGCFRQGVEGWGIESEMDEVLSAKKDSLDFFVLSNGRRIPAYSSKEYKALSGGDVFLTIDFDYQKILSEELLKQLERTNSEYANGIIVDPYSGEILAMATLPNADLNKSLKNQELTRDRTTYDSKEPGSTIKPFSILAGIDNNIISLYDKEYCEGQVEDGDEAKYFIPSIKRTIKDHEGRDTLTVGGVLAYSSNIGTVKLAMKIKSNLIYNTLRKFGFGHKTGIDFYNEDEGYLKSLSEWDKHSLISISIGQEMRANNLQLAMAYSAIANGGYLVEPKLIRDISGHNNYKIKNSPVIIRKVAKKESISDIVKALKLVMNEGTGQDYKEDYCIYGKTGTAEVFVQAEDFIDCNRQKDICANDDNWEKWMGNDRWDDGEEFIDTNKNKKWDKAGYSTSTYMPSFAGVFPCEDPQLVCIVSFFGPNKEDRWGGATAIPVVQNIFKRLKLRDKELIL